VKPCLSDFVCLPRENGIRHGTRSNKKKGNKELKQNKDDSEELLYLMSVFWRNLDHQNEIWNSLCLENIEFGMNYFWIPFNLYLISDSE